MRAAGNATENATGDEFWRFLRRVVLVTLAVLIMALTRAGERKSSLLLESYSLPPDPPSPRHLDVPIQHR